MIRKGRDSRSVLATSILATSIYIAYIYLVLFFGLMQTVFVLIDVFIIFEILQNLTSKMLDLTSKSHLKIFRGSMHPNPLPSRSSVLEFFSPPNIDLLLTLFGTTLLKFPYMHRGEGGGGGL